MKRLPAAWITSVALSWGSAAAPALAQPSAGVSPILSVLDAEPEPVACWLRVALSCTRA